MDYDPVENVTSTTGLDPSLDMLNSGDTAWMLCSTALVLIMTPGRWVGGRYIRQHVMVVVESLQAAPSADLWVFGN